MRKELMNQPGLASEAKFDSLDFWISYVWVASLRAFQQTGSSYMEAHKITSICIGLLLQLLIWNWIFFAESCEEGATSDHYIKKKLKSYIEGAFLSKTKNILTLATSFENTNQLKT